MSDDEVLSEEEKDALMQGVKSKGDNPSTPATPPGEVSVVDFSCQERIVRGEMPVLERIHEKLSKSIVSSIYSIMGRDITMKMDELKTQKFKDFILTLEIPASINIARFHPLRGKSMLVLDSKLVYSLVDHYFGGHGQEESNITERDFTKTEIRIKDIMLAKFIKDLESAWERTLKMQVEIIGVESNPQLANTYSQEEVIVLTTFTINFTEKSFGKFYIVIPYAMLEPIREELYIGANQSSDDIDPNWIRSMQEQVLDVSLNLRATLAKTELSLGRVSNLKVGDIISIEIPDTVTLDIEGVPAFDTKYGKSKDKCALKILKPYIR